MASFKVNPDRLPRPPRLPWANFPEWRPTWSVPEVEVLAEQVERLWCREPMNVRTWRRIEVEAHRLERWRLKHVQQAEVDKRRAELAEIKKALGEIERALDAAAARTAPQGGDDADII